MRLYQAFLSEHQRAHLCDTCIPYDARSNVGNDVREYELFRAIGASEGGDDPWGLISWKFEHKTCVPVAAFRAFCEREFRAGSDCAFINPMIANEAMYRNVWEQGEHCGHVGMARIAEHLGARAGIDTSASMGTDSFSLSNFFVGTPAFWDAYLAFVDGVLAELDAQARDGTEVGAIFTGNARYRRDPDATMRIFVIERLFSSFVKARPEIRCAAFPHPKVIYAEKLGAKLGTLLYRLSVAKNRALATNDEALLALWDDARRGFVNDLYVTAVWNMDDPHEIHLGERYAKLAGALAALGLDP